jgi:hypothetical protein
MYQFTGCVIDADSGLHFGNAKVFAKSAAA